MTDLFVIEKVYVKNKNGNYVRKNPYCKLCGVFIPCNASWQQTVKLHECAYFFHRRIEEFGECVKG